MRWSSQRIVPGLPLHHACSRITTVGAIGKERQLLLTQVANS